MPKRKKRAATTTERVRTHRRPPATARAASQVVGRDTSRDAVTSAVGVETEPNVVATLRTPDRLIPVVVRDTATGVTLQREAMQWSYIVRNRKRWAKHDELPAKQAERAKDLLRKLGLDAPELGHIAAAGAVQVAIPYHRESDNWATRILPWEFLLSAATTDLRRYDEPLTVLRQLERQESGASPSAEPPRAVLFVESAPYLLDRLYTFETEQDLVGRNLGAPTVLRNPSREELRASIQTTKWDVIHVAGFDSHQAVHVVEGRGGVDPDRKDGAENPEEVKRPQKSPLDGLALRGKSGRLDLISASELGELLRRDDNHRPRLVTFNCWNSGARTAAMAVAAGATAAIGFQDSFDDNLAEAFYSAFYRAWRDSDWNLRVAFGAAWTAIRGDAALVRGTGISLWSADPLVGAGVDEKVIGTLRRKVEETVKVEESTEYRPDRVGADKVADYLWLDVNPFREINYSLLHNRRPLFERFNIVRRVPGRFHDVSVTVELNCGGRSFPYRRTLSVTRNLEMLASDVHVSLTEDLVRSIRESITTSLFVEVLWGQHVLHRETYPVRLLPPDQWCDTDADRDWLPSFVLPRDPATTQLISDAYRYVRVLRDDPGAGFDGYQSVDDALADRSEQVDLQVQAIWSAILHGWQLGYANPPPVYSEGLDSQRLRTPSMMRRERTGTCIDLSLLVAACLELVDIYPVIFLLNDHAFPGYWRDSKWQEEFRVMAGDAEGRGAHISEASGIGGSVTPEWMFGNTAFEEIRREIRKRHLVPIESVWLTQNKGFGEAIEAGQENLGSKSQFLCMIDIVTARTSQVTPLPLREEPA